jgi:hypothetical protein
MSEAFSLLSQALPEWLRRDVVRIPRHAAIAYDASVWRGALAVLEQGTIIVETVNGARTRLDEGAVLCLTGLALASIHNACDDEVVITVARRETDTSAPDSRRRSLGEEGEEGGRVEDQL